MCISFFCYESLSSFVRVVVLKIYFLRKIHFWCKAQAFFCLKLVPHTFPNSPFVIILSYSSAPVAHNCSIYPSPCKIPLNLLQNLLLRVHISIYGYFFFQFQVQTDYSWIYRPHFCCSIVPVLSLFHTLWRRNNIYIVFWNYIPFLLSWFLIFP